MTGKLGPPPPENPGAGSLRGRGAGPPAKRAATASCRLADLRPDGIGQVTGELTVRAAQAGRVWRRRPRQTGRTASGRPRWSKCCVSCVRRRGGESVGSESPGQELR
jgi:hypothetical protein